MARDKQTNDRPPAVNRIELGKVVGVWGVKGWLKIYSYTRERHDVGRYARWLLARPGNLDDLLTVDVAHCRMQGQNVVAKLAGIDDRNAAELLIGRIIYIEDHQLEPLPAGEFYWFQLVGMQVLTTAGDDLGQVDSLMETGANDVLVVQQQQADQTLERLIPYVDSVVQDVNVVSNIITVDWDADYLVSSQS